MRIRTDCFPNSPIELLGERLGDRESLRMRVGRSGRDAAGVAPVSPSAPEDGPKLGGRDDPIVAGRGNCEEVLISRDQKFGCSGLGELEEDTVVGVRKVGQRGGRLFRLNGHLNGLREGKKVTEKGLDLLIGQVESGIREDPEKFRRPPASSWSGSRRSFTGTWRWLLRRKASR